MEELREMPSIESVLHDGQLESGSGGIVGDCPAVTTMTMTAKMKNSRKARPAALDREALQTSATRLPACDHVEMQRARIFGNHKDAAVSSGATPASASLGSFRSIPEAGLYHAAINTSLTNVALRSRKACISHIASTTQRKVDKPWLSDHRRTKSHAVAFWTFVLAATTGLIGSALLLYMAYASVPRDKYCLVLDEQFQGRQLNRSIWFYEQQTGGFGNGEFEWTTDHANNTFIQDSTLYMVPTLTSDHVGEAAITNGYTLNLSASDVCTAANRSDVGRCVVTSNITSGEILPPVQSARIMTNFSTTIRYGRVEVRARMPTGSWLWPAIWMLPSTNVYGEWPRSGEIDIVESKGNAPTHRTSDAANNMHSTLHFGPSWLFDGYGFATKIRKLWHSYYDQQFHTFGLDWTPDGIFIWERSRVWRNLQVDFRRTKNFWSLGQFPERMANGTLLTNPWSAVAESTRAAPFDQHFYLILNVAVGGTNGFFQDGLDDNKPWSNHADNARKQFWDSRDQWLPTWPADPTKRGMAVQYVKMWQLC